MLGGAYLCFEGAEKVYHVLFPQGDHAVAADFDTADPARLEEEKIAGAIKTDFILSAEIMTIALAAIPAGTLVTEAITLAVVGVMITVGVYGAVALIVKMDDIGLHMAANSRTSAGRGLGRGLVVAMPKVMTFLSTVGTAAMLWVGGSIVLHGLYELHIWEFGHVIEGWAEAVAHLVPAAAGLVAWAVKAVLDGILGLALGLALIPVATRVIAPVWGRLFGGGKAAH